jgi:hypothetical protein
MDQIIKITMHLILTFRDTFHEESDLEIKFKINENPFAAKWIELLIENLFLTNFPIEKVFCLNGWADSFDNQKIRNIDHLSIKLNQAIDTINQNLGPKGYGPIEIRADRKLFEDRIKARDFLNDIHHHFELLIGQVWSPSPWYQLAGRKTADSIRSLNNICHEIEALIESIDKKNSAPRVNISLNGPNFEGNYFLEKKRIDLTFEDYQQFQKEAKWGSIFLYYSQLGKTHMEAFTDGDEYIDRSNISGYRYITGEFMVEFRNRLDYRNNVRFIRWLKDYDYDPEDITLGLDKPVLAQIETELTQVEMVAELKKRNDLYKISLWNQDQLLYTTTYDYTWEDQENLIKY